MAADRRYWDSNAFLGWLNAEADKVGKCEGVLTAAMKPLARLIPTRFRTSSLLASASTAR